MKPGLLRALPGSTVIVLMIAMHAAGAGKDDGMNFVKTDSSSEWVKRTFRIQERYRRVLVVSPDGTAGATIEVPPLDLEAPSGRAPVAYPVAAAFRTLQEAADASQGGDLVAVMPGTYDGFRITGKPDAADGNYVHFRAMGRPGQVVINTAAPESPGWMIYLVGDVHHVILQGFNIDGSEAPRRTWGTRGTRGTLPSGILIQGLFHVDGKWAHHIIVTDVFSHDHDSWGLHSVNSHTVLIQDCCFTGQTREHGAYVSDGSHNYVIRRNVFQGNASGGLQCNIDPFSTLRRLAAHPELRDYPRYEPTYEWATGLIRLATEKFGKGAFPDGRGTNFIIENNVMTGNGRNGGGALNLAALQDSLIQNNLIYNNANHGIGEWDNATPFNPRHVADAPDTPEEARDKATLPQWGCRGNRIRNNTVLLDNPTRFAMGFLNGSWGNRVRNNVLVNANGTSMEVTSTGILDLDSGYNVAGDVRFLSISGHSWPRPGKPGGPMPESLKGLARKLDATNHSTLGVTRERIAAEFVRPGNEPWVIFENGWWRLNPDRPDFHPKPGSTLLSGRGDPTDLPPVDLSGEPRRSPDVGAFRSAPVRR